MTYKNKTRNQEQEILMLNPLTQPNTGVPADARLKHIEERLVPLKHRTLEENHFLFYMQIVAYSITMKL